MDSSSLVSLLLSSSEPARLLTPRTLLALREPAGVFNLEVAGVVSFERDFRDEVFLLSSRAFLRKSCMVFCQRTVEVFKYFPCAMLFFD